MGFDTLLWDPVRSWAGREMEKNDLICLTYFCSLVTLCGSSSFCSSWECLCWSCELNPDPADLGSSSWVWAEWSHPGLQGMPLESHTHLSFWGITRTWFCICYLLFTRWIFLLFQSQLEKTWGVCWLWKGWLVNVISFYTGWQGGISLPSLLMQQSLSFCVSSTFLLQILYKARDLDSEPKSQTVRGNHTQSVLLSGLRKFVLYELQVLAFTRIGDGVPSSPAVTERTKDDGELKAYQNNHLVSSSLFMRISSSGASVGIKYLDFGEIFFFSFEPKGCCLYLV